MKRSFLFASSLIAVAFIAGTSMYLINRMEKGSEKTVATVLGMTYRNPFQLADEWPDYGIGDPYVFRHNGKYYLYCSTKDFRIGVKAWSSDNLIDWKYEGLVTEDPVTTGAYAPEVIYSNGWFYMYTSPAGQGHYVLRSESPTGPFTVQTGNLGLSIDGSVFIDDDGRWYFTRADSGGIVGHPMNDPYSMEAGVKLNTSMGHWTEGSMIIKRNGRYYMTYTGNHVFSKGYRINYAVAKDSPLGLYRPGLNNPIVISTESAFNGLGHSSTVMGPDLDSCYLFYHNLIGRSAEGPPVRMLNMDRLIFNGDKMSVAGPTRTNSPAPAMPVFSDVPGETPSPDKWTQTVSKDGARTWLGKTGTEGRFTAEFNFTTGNGDPFVILFSFQDGQNYRSLTVFPSGLKAAYSEVREGTENVRQNVQLLSGTDLSKLHTVRIESAEEGLLIYWDGMKLIEDAALERGAGRIGYRIAGDHSPDLQYTAFSNQAGGTSDYDAVKTVPGVIEAIHYMEGRDRGFHSRSRTDMTALRRADGMSISEEEDGTYSLRLTDKGDWVNYPVNVLADGEYLLAIMAKSPPENTILDIGVDGIYERYRIDASQFVGDSWTKVPLGRMKLSEGPHTLTVKLVQGSIPFRFLESAAVSPTGEIAPVHSLQPADPESMMGDWRQNPDESYSLSSAGRDGKWYFGEVGWTDYTAQMTIRRHVPDTLEECAILFRTTHESDFPDQVRDAFSGYELAFRNDRVILRKINYEQLEEVASGILPFGSSADAAQEVKVELKGNSIRVSGGGTNAEPLLEWKDHDAFLHGRVGIRASSPDWSFSDISVSPVHSLKKELKS